MIKANRPLYYIAFLENEKHQTTWIHVLIIAQTKKSMAPLHFQHMHDEDKVNILS